MIKVIGPWTTWNGQKWKVIRYFTNQETKRMFHLVFEIVFDDRSNKWHHFGIPDQQDSLCKERLYQPRLDCECIRACKAEMEQ